jgi:predicted dehydrogenase
MATGRLDVRSLVTDRLPIDDAAKAYERLNDGGSLGIVLQYPGEPSPARRIENRAVASAVRLATVPGPLRVGVIGAGRFTRSTILPLLQRAGVELLGIASASGTNAAELATKFGFRYSAAGSAEIIGDAETDVVFITTPHNTHARLVVDGLANAKHVFVEKPLCIDEEQLTAIERAYEKHALPNGLRLMCGFNRRFAPLTVKAAALLGSGDVPLSMVYTVNAGALPRGHWAGDFDIGGGRIVGEGCHFIDLLSFLARAPVASVHAVTTGAAEDEATIVVRMTNGSTGTLHYFSSGHRSFPKETLEIFVGGRVLVLRNFRSLRGYGVARFRRMALWSQDKGHRQAIESFLRAIRQGEETPIPFDSLTNITRATFAAVRAARSGGVERCV